MNKKNKPQKIEHNFTEVEQSLFDKFTNELQLNSEVSSILAKDQTLALFFEKTLEHYNSPVNIANIVTNEVAKELKEFDISDLKFTPNQIAQLVTMIDDETISTKIAKDVFEDMKQTGTDPKIIVDEKGLIQISDPDIINPIIDEIITKNPENVEKYKSGNNKLFGFFVGQVLKATNGKANPKIINELVKNKLD
jgi:glutaminyl-tRNA synthetase